MVRGVTRQEGHKKFFDVLMLRADTSTLKFGSVTKCAVSAHVKRSEGLPESASCGGLGRTGAIVTETLIVEESVILHNVLEGNAMFV